jgi:hypothetical protein
MPRRSGFCRGEGHDESLHRASPKGRQEGSAIDDDYVVEEEGDHVLKAFKTQEEGLGEE